MPRLLSAGLALAMFGAPGAGETSQVFAQADETFRQSAPTISETEFLAALDEGHPAVVERAQAVALAEAEVVRARTLESPTFGAIREEPDELSTETELVLAWQLPNPGRGARIEAAEQVTKAASARLAQDMTALRLALRRTYADWASAWARADRLTRQADRIAALARRETTRAERGEASGLEAHRLGLAASELRSRAVLAAAAATAASAEVRSWHPAVSIDARPELPEVPSVPAEVEVHPLITAAEAELEAATLARKAAGRYVRSPELLVGWKRVELGQESVDGPVLGLGWSLPLLDRQQAERAAGDALVRSAEARLESVRREIGAQREVARGVYDSLVAAHAEARATNIANDRMLDASETAFRHGELSLTDLLETLRSVTESELATLELRMAALAAHRELERLSPGA